MKDITSNNYFSLAFISLAPIKSNFHEITPNFRCPREHFGGFKLIPNMAIIFKKRNEENTWRIVVGLNSNATVTGKLGSRSGARTIHSYPSLTERF